MGIRQGLMGMLSRLREPRAEDRAAVRDEKETARVEAFSDGVFAVAMVLLVLGLHPPTEPDTAHLRAALLALWPAYVAFLTSFATLGIWWLTHHRMFTSIGRVDHGLLVRNGFVLLGVALTPFASGVVANTLGRDGDRLAVSVYAGVFLVVTLALGLLWTYVTSRKRRPPLLRVDHRHPDVRDVSARLRIAPVTYLAAIVVANYHALAGLGLTLALAITFALPPRTRR